MMDIILVEQGRDLGIQDTIVAKAGNLLGTQLGGLSYAESFGVDLSYFLTSGFQFQNETFRSYCIQKMIENQINVNNIEDTVETLFETLGWDVGDKSESQPYGGLIL